MKTVRNVIEIKLDKIKVINPRDRDPARFAENVASIQRVGLKRPIVVNSRYVKEHGMYELVCGQGRIEAFRKLKRDTIPALTVDVDRETALIMSIAENATRTPPPPIWFAQVIKGLSDARMPLDQIGIILDRGVDVIRDYLVLIKQGDKQLIEAVERGSIPVRTAMAIAKEPNGQLQQLLARGIENGLFDRTEIPAVRKLIYARTQLQKNNGATKTTGKRNGHEDLTIEALRREIKHTLDKQDDFVRKSQRYENQTVILAEALQRLNSDGDWVTIIEQEQLTNYPKLKGELLQNLFTVASKGNTQ